MTEELKPPTGSGESRAACEKRLNEISQSLQIPAIVFEKIPGLPFPIAHSTFLEEAAKCIELGRLNSPTIFEVDEMMAKDGKQELFGKTERERLKKELNESVVVKIDPMAAPHGRRCPVCGSQSCTKAWDSCSACETERGTD